MSDNWVVSTLENALSNWNDHLAEIWSLVSQTPESFRGGEIWTVIVSIHNALVGIGYGLLVLFFAMGVFRSAASFRELQRPEFALRHFIRFLLAKVAVGSSLELITAIYKICGGVVSTVMGLPVRRRNSSACALRQSGKRRAACCQRIGSSSAACSYRAMA